MASTSDREQMTRFISSVVGGFLPILALAYLALLGGWIYFLLELLGIKARPGYASETAEIVIDWIFVTGIPIIFILTWIVWRKIIKRMN